MADVTKQYFWALIQDALKRDATRASKVARVVWLVEQITTLSERAEVIEELQHRTSDIPAEMDRWAMSLTAEQMEAVERRQSFATKIHEELKQPKANDSGTEGLS